MPDWESKPVAATPPEGYVPVVLTADQLQSPLRICVLVKKEPDPAAGHFIVLRDAIDSKVLLGCICDHAGAIHRWVEIWIQDVDGLADVAPACVEALSNDALDRRWEAHAKAFETAMPGTMVHTGWEREQGVPLFVDCATFTPVPLTDADSGDPWHLCCDDQVLQERGLPPYSSSLHRYLHLPARGKDTSFIPVTRNAPTGDATVPLEQVTGKRSLLAINAGGGLMMVHPHSDIELEPFIDVLSGGHYQGITHGRGNVDLEGMAATAAGDMNSRLTSDGRLFLGTHGRSGRLVETFYLKLHLLAEAVRQVRTIAQATQKPFLNLSPGSFQVYFGSMSSALPYLWTTRLAVVDPGDAVALPIRAGDADYYLPGSTASSIYRPGSASAAVQGNGTFRIRQTLESAGDMTVLEGTFATQERITVTRSDLVWFRLDLKVGRVDLYGRLEEQTAMAAGEWRFRTVGQRFDAATVQSLRAAEGIQMATRFEVIPLLSTPCDLYALAVLAVRMLLVDNEATLAVALDETMSLAQQASTISDGDGDGDGDGDIRARIGEVFGKDDRYVKSLGPHRLCHEEIAPDEAFDLVPDDLWYSTLALITRMFPGAGRDSFRADYGDAPHGGVHKVFDAVLDELDRILVKLRSLIVIDWRYNREIHRVIRRHLMT